MNFTHDLGMHKLQNSKFACQAELVLPTEISTIESVTQLGQRTSTLIRKPLLNSNPRMVGELSPLTIVKARGQRLDRKDYI